MRPFFQVLLALSLFGFYILYMFEPLSVNLLFTRLLNPLLLLN